MKRRNFIQNSSKFGLAVSIFGVYSCKENKKKEMVGTENEKPETAVESAAPFFQLSLAQWSINRMIREDGMDPYTFAEKAKDWGFSGLEYVSQLYSKELGASDYSDEAMANFVAKCNKESQKYGLKNLIIMIDHEGDLSAVSADERKEAVKKHQKWVDAAAAMGCHSVRVNLMGAKTKEEWIVGSVDGLTQLATYAKEKNIHVIVENHGGLSSNAGLLAQVMEEVSMDNCGTLPDFGNFCVQREDGSYFNSPCIEQYDIYKGVKELMPYAKAVSAKSHDFDAEGNETEIDYVKMLQIVKDAGYKGFIGVEYEGNEMGEKDGIMATKNLLLTAAKKLS
ncbi:MAG: sugar phosphate isomerase/epimerase family protein [Bacteroidota bacterium]